MPVILGVIVLFIHIAMFCHDRCVLEYICQTACTEAVYSEEDAKSAAEEYIDISLSKMLMGSWDTDVAVYSDDESIMAEIEASTKLFPRVFTHTARANKHFCPKY